MFDTENTTLFQDVSALELRFEELTEHFQHADPQDESAQIIWGQLCDVANAIQNETQR